MYDEPPRRPSFTPNPPQGQQWPPQQYQDPYPPGPPPPPYGHAPYQPYAQQQEPYGQQPRPPQGPHEAWRQYYQQAPGPQQPYPPQQPYAPQQQQPYQPPGQMPPPGRRARRKSWMGRHRFLTGLIGLAAFVGIIVAATSGGKQPAAPAAAVSSPAATAQATATASASASPASVKARTVATFTGSGTQKTPRFAVTSTWKLVYSFNCASFGMAGNFQVFEDGGSDFNGVSVNDLAMSKSSSTWAYSDAGSHYLEINSECSWKVKVVDEP
ncbi:MAG: hypothetical protein ACRDOL_21060 [Streptosporangiaceae bacterium]